MLVALLVACGGDSAEAGDAPTFLDAFEVAYLARCEETACVPLDGDTLQPLATCDELVGDARATFGACGGYDQDAGAACLDSIPVWACGEDLETRHLDPDPSCDPVAVCGA